MQLRAADRLLWVVLARVWSHWRDALILVKPETVISWQRRGFRCYWRWKSRARPAGRPALGAELIELVKTMHQANPTARSPWQNAYAERFIGSLRRECLDHIITLSERHLLRVARSYADYDNRTRTHLALGKDPPDGRTVQGPEAGAIIAFPEVGGLHHRYERRAAA